MSMSDEKITNFIEKKGDRIRKPFVPLTGNPENHDYADWYRALRGNGSVAEIHRSEKTGDQS